MTITTLILYTAIAGGIVTGLSSLLRKPENWLVDYVKNFVGCLFIFSGFVKAVDPNGTAYKMMDYLAEFDMGFLNPTALLGSIFTIVLELALGVALILGIFPKWTVRLLVPLIIFFLFLTGYTSVTGNVTDCGCFGDFLKLKPIVSFSKDIFLGVLIAFLFWKWREITPVLPKDKVAKGILGALTFISLLFCINYSYFNLPPIDFRPFHVGVNIPEAKAIADADKGESIRYMTLENKDTKEVREVTSTEYTADKTLWQKGTPWVLDKDKTREVILSEGSTSKIKEFEFVDVDGMPIWEELMADPNYSFMIIAYKLEKANKDAFKNTVNPVLREAEKAGMKTFAVTKFNSQEDIDLFRHEVQAAYPFYTADDILLKTVIRSNPGIMLMKNGTIVEKWHYNKLPNFAEIKVQYMK